MKGFIVIDIYALPNEVVDRIFRERCRFCTKKVTAVDAMVGNIGISRIDGDSENGYEMYHTECARRKG